MLRIGLVAALVGGALAIAACNTVRGAAADVNSVANCTENAINTGRCKEAAAASQKDSPAGAEPAGLFCTGS